jgi:hypothetical protein
MWKHDLRLLGLTELVNQAIFQKYKDAIADHPYTDLPAVITWLAAQLGSQNSITDKTAIAAQLWDGDRHYAGVFLRLDLLPQDRDPALPVEPLSYSVDKILEVITGKSLRVDSDATVYGYLEEALLMDLARLAAEDNRYAGYERWQALIERFGQSGTFYTALVTAIPENAIQNYRTSLAAPYDPDNVVRYVSQGDKRMEADAFQRDYLERIDKYRQTAPAVFVSKLTDNSDTMLLADTQILKKDLVSRLGREAEVAWIDGLRWPLAQAATLNGYQDLAEIATLVAQLVAQRDRLQSPFVHLLLIMLEQYVDIMRRISFNLHQFEQTAGHYYHKPAISQQLHAEGQARLAAWKAREIQTTVSNLLAPVLAIENPTDELQHTLFGWVTTQDRERWLNNPHARLVLQTIDELHEHYLKAFAPGKWPKAQLLKAIAADPIDWKKFKLLYSLWSSDETDEALRSELKEQMASYLRSDQFSWNSGYQFDNDHCTQALQLTNLYFGLPNAKGELAELTKTTRTWHEGWAYRGASGFKDSNRYIFLLTCGMCLAYLRYDSGDTAGATESWKAYLEETVAQYRSTRSELDRQHYLLPFRLLFHTLLKFDELALPDLLDKLFRQIDHIEHRIYLAHSLMETTGFLEKMLTADIRDKIGALLQAQYWILELRLKHAKHPEQIRQYEMLYKAVLPWLTSP